MRFVLPPANRPRNTLVRILLSIIGLAVLGFFAVFGLIVAGVLLAVGGVFLLIRQWKLSHQPTMQRTRAGDTKSTGATDSSGAQPDVLEGEFVVVEDKHTHR